jgi:Cu-processing system permease protein
VAAVLERVAIVALNAYREAVRARVLYGLLALALASCAYSLVVGTLSLHQELRVVADLGAASISIYTILVAIVLGATSLHRELELKTIFPILTRPLRRHEYLVGKYAGTLGTLAVFIALDGGAVLGILALEAGQKVWLVAGAAGLLALLLAVLLITARFTRVFVVIPWSFALFAAMALLAAPAGGERQLVLASAALTLMEAMIVTAVATLFASFSSPFLTAIFTIGVFLVGRSADTLANLPPRFFGQFVHDLGRALSHVFPNLNVYVPPRALLLGQVIDTPVWPFVGIAGVQAVLCSTVLLALGALIFRKRDFE